MSMLDALKNMMSQPAPQTATPQGQAPVSPNAAPGAQPDSSLSNLNPNAAPPGSPSSTVADNKGQTTSAPAKTTSPLDDFAKIWENSPAAQQAHQRPRLTADPVKIGEAAKKLDFSRVVDPALAQKALAGDAEAFVSVLNGVAQEVFSLSTQASTHLVDRHTSAALDHVQGELPGQLRRFNARDSLMSENPTLANPAITPLLNLIQDRVAQQYPTATGPELKAYSEKYLTGIFATMFPDAVSSYQKSSTAQEDKTPNPFARDPDFDFGNWLEGRQPAPTKQ